MSGEEGSNLFIIDFFYDILDGLYLYLAPDVDVEFWKNWDL